MTKPVDLVRHVISILLNSKSHKCLRNIKGYDLQRKIAMSKYKLAARNTKDINLQVQIVVIEE
jgi:hypothetical protein